MQVNWYPGHMAKTRRLIAEHLKQVDVVAEIVDARIPISSRNPDVDAIVGAKPRVIILNRADQADPAGNRAWGAYFKSRGWAVVETDAKSGKGVNQFAPVVRALLKDQIAAWAAKGYVGRQVKAMVVGVPNVGKSTFINHVAKRKTAGVQNRPGYTRGKQWVYVDKTLELLDTPGILWPKFDDPAVGMRLAWTGAVKDEVVDTEELGCALIELLSVRYPQALTARYKIECPQGAQGWELLQQAGRKRGFLISGGEIDTERMGRVLLDEYRSCKLGRLTLELPEEVR